jgi:hypothetical protein
MQFGLSGSIYQLVNGALLIVVFTAVRICFGLLMSWQFFSDILLSPINAHRISAWHKLLYAVANIVLMSLNLVWIGRMLRAFTRRLLSSRAVGHKKVRSSSAQ